MNIQPLYEYYRFGYNYRLLLEGKKRVAIKLAIKSMESYLAFLQEHNLRVTLEVVEEKLRDLIIKFQNYALKDAKLSELDSEELSKVIKFADATLDGELGLRNAYILTEKRLGIVNLLDDVSNLFSEGIYENLPKISQYDFSEAGKCIAFERPTGAAFHILRGCEGVLKMYYDFIVKRKKDRISVCTWGPMVTDLRTKKNIPKPLLDILDNIRVNFRNPTAHPDTILNRYTLDEAQGLFSLCIDAVNRLVTDYNKRSRKQP